MREAQSDANFGLGTSLNHDGEEDMHWYGRVLQLDTIIWSGEKMIIKTLHNTFGATTTVDQSRTSTLVTSQRVATIRNVQNISRGEI